MIYLYESCVSTLTNATKKTQVGQTVKLEFTNLVNTIFKDSAGVCWNYLGEYEDDFIPSDSVFYIFYSGNFLTNNIELYYPDCQTCLTTSVSTCNTIYFEAERCDSGTTVYVKVCDVSPVGGTLRLLPTVGDIVGVRNNSGDDFCVTLKSTSSFVDGAYQISTPAWKSYTCDTCPLYKSYIVDACDGSVTGLTVYTPSTNTTLPNYTSVRLNIDTTCYIIRSYQGISCEYNYNEQSTPTILQSFPSCDACLIDYYKTLR
jgi:hypothetical protein